VVEVLAQETPEARGPGAAGDPPSGEALSRSSALERLPPPVQSAIGLTRGGWHRARNRAWWALRWSKHWTLWTTRWARHWTMHGARSAVRTARNPIRERRFIRPRLGQLSHHAPCPMRLPARYAMLRPPQCPPRISIVTPSYNQAHLIERTIRSVLDQAYPNLEYIVQDGASRDGTAEVLARFSDRLHHWESVPDRGQTDAINRGFQHASGDILAYLNSDDLLLPGALSAVARYFMAHPEIDVVYGHRILIDEQDREIGRWVLPPHDDRVLSWADYVPQETLFWRRRAWEKLGSRFDETFQFAMDWDLLLRLRDAGARFKRLPRFLGAFRIHERQKTSASISDLGMQEMSRLRQRTLGYVPEQEEIHMRVAPYLARHLVCHCLFKVGLARY
jgi:GT2 family glycosyltransferase